MLPNPLHAAVVHFPVVLALLLPVFAVGALIAIRRGTRVRTAWGLTTAIAATLLAASWASLETGESEERKVEEIVGEAPIERHEEAAQRFFTIVGGVLVVSLAGLAAGRVGSAARMAAAVGSLAAVAAAVSVGHSGGSLVYVHNAGAAYSAPSATAERIPADNGGTTAGAETASRSGRANHR